MPICSPSFWRGKNIALTGHTGFKGAWFAMWLSSMGAKVHGYALEPTTNPSLFTLAKVNDLIESSTIADIRDRSLITTWLAEINPDIIFHLAAQPLVIEGYKNPIETYETNVMGTANILEAARYSDALRSIVVVTTDKVYENLDWAWGYREIDQLGGSDPYSNSKACCELVVQAYKKSFFHREKDPSSDSSGASKSSGIDVVGIASARAGNVIGGGDWAANRLVPDFTRAAESRTGLVLRNPRATRPWQHVLEPLSGYMLLAEKLWESPRHFSEAWNFGPDLESIQPVEAVVNILKQEWPERVDVNFLEDPNAVHEANLLSLDYSKASSRLGWRPKWGLRDALKKVVEFSVLRASGGDVREICMGQIADFVESARA